MRVCEHVRERGVEERSGPEMMDDVCADQTEICDLRCEGSCCGVAYFRLKNHLISLSHQSLSPRLYTLT